MKMSTRIDNPELDCGVELDNDFYDEVRLRVRDGLGVFVAILSAPDFIAAVEKECSGTFIPDSELPEVEDNGAAVTVAGEVFYPNGVNFPASVARARKYLLTDLALLKHLEARPPVDDAQVEKIAAIFDGVEADNGWHTTLARRLVAAGVRVEVDK